VPDLVEHVITLPVTVNVVPVMSLLAAPDPVVTVERLLLQPAE